MAGHGMTKVLVTRRLVELLAHYLQQTSFSISQPKEAWDDARQVWEEIHAVLAVQEASPKGEGEE
jgi:hypothetical protein